MPTYGPNNPSSAASASNADGNNIYGAWTNTGNVFAADGSVSETPNASSANTVDQSARIIKGGATTGTNQATNAALPLSLSYLSYGGSSSLMGATLTPTDVNASNFGFAWAWTASGIPSWSSQWLQTTGFGFSVPAGETVDGVLAEVRVVQSGGPGNWIPQVDHVRITVYTTAAGGGNRLRRFLTCAGG